MLLEEDSRSEPAVILETHSSFPRPAVLIRWSLRRFLKGGRESNPAVTAVGLTTPIIFGAANPLKGRVAQPHSWPPRCRVLFKEETIISIGAGIHKYYAERGAENGQRRED